jgi:hypothetical protein
MSQTNYPVVFKTIDPNFRSTAYGGRVVNPNGYDIRPFDVPDLTLPSPPPSQPLPFQLKRYVASTGEIVMWIKPPSISSAQDTKIRLTCGDPALNSDGSTPAMWDLHYKGVYHPDLVSQQSPAPAPFDIALPAPIGFVQPTRYSGNPIINYGGGGWKDSQVQEPWVFFDPTDNTKLIMLFAGMAAPPASGQQSIGIATALASDPYHWTECSANPFITGQNRRLDCVLVIGTDVWVYCSNGQNGNIDLFISHNLSYVTANNGTATLNFAANVLQPSGGELLVQQCGVIQDVAQWFMVYGTRTTPADNPSGWLKDVRLATSTDGMNWTKVQDASGNPLVLFTIGGNGASDHTFIETKWLMKIGGKYVILYDAYNGLTTGPEINAQYSIHAAISDRMDTGWVKSDLNPWFSASNVAGLADSSMVATLTSWIEIGGIPYLFYQGCNTYPRDQQFYWFQRWNMCMAQLPAGTSILDLFDSSLFDATVNAADLGATDLTLQPAGQVVNAINCPTRYNHAGRRQLVLSNTNEFTLLATIKPTVPQLGIIAYFGENNGVTGYSTSAGWQNPYPQTGFGLGVGDGAGGAGNKLVGLFAVPVVSGQPPIVWIDSRAVLTSDRVRVAMVRKAGVTSFYVNGVLQLGTSTLTPVTPIEGFHLAGINQIWPFAGEIEELRVSDIARLADWILTDFNNLRQPNSFIYYARAATQYFLSGPSSGDNGAPSDPFTVEVPYLATVDKPITVTPNAGAGGGTFTPPSVVLTTATPKLPFTYTPASTGNKTISVTNDRGLPNPPSLAFTALVPFLPSNIAGLQAWYKISSLSLANNAPVTSWPDSSGNARNLSVTNQPPIFKTAQTLNGKAAINFNGTNQGLKSAFIGTNEPLTVFVVGRQMGTLEARFLHSGALLIVSCAGNGNPNSYAGGASGLAPSPALNFTGAFHAFIYKFVPYGTSEIYVDGNLVASGVLPGQNPLTDIFLMSDGGTGAVFFPGDQCEFGYYNSALSPTNITALSTYLKKGYGIP